MTNYNYEPTKDGNITAIRIYYEEDGDMLPVADLTFVKRKSITIRWDRCSNISF